MNIVEINREEIKNGLADGSLVIIDVREETEYVNGHIPGAILLPLSRFDPSQLAAFSDKRIVFSCNSGNRTRQALAFAQAAGWPLHEHYKGSFQDWIQSGEIVHTGLQP